MNYLSEMGWSTLQGIHSPEMWIEVHPLGKMEEKCLHFWKVSLDLKSLGNLQFYHAYHHSHATCLCVLAFPVAAYEPVFS